MARPIKKGLDFFPLDVIVDDNLELLEAECGLEGFAIIIKLWQKIYATSYFIDWEEDNALLFARKINSDLTTVNKVVNVGLNRGLFNKNLFNSYKILTSKGIQSRYIKICSDANRKNYDIKKEHNLIIPQETIVKSEETPVKSEETPVKSEFSTQSKVNKSKEDNKRFVPPTIDEVLQYCKERENSVNADKFINFYESKGWVVGKTKMKSWKAAVRTWESKNKEDIKKSEEKDCRNGVKIIECFGQGVSKRNIWR